MRTIAVFLFCLALWGCHIEPTADELVEHMVVQTRHDGNTAFSFYNSFTLSMDTLGFLSNVSNDTLFLDEDYAPYVTQAFKSNMEEAGFTYLEKNQSPDLGIAAYIVQNYSVFQTVNYPTYYSGYYGYGYGGYYGVPYVSTYINSSWTMVVNLIDLKNRDSQGRLKVIWTAYIGDLARSNDQVGKVLEAINQAYDQSPYLHK